MHPCILKYFFCYIFKVAVMVFLLYGNVNSPILLSQFHTCVLKTVRKQAACSRPPSHLTHPAHSASLTGPFYTGLYSVHLELSPVCPFVQTQGLCLSSVLLPIWRYGSANASGLVLTHVRVLLV